MNNIDEIKHQYPEIYKIYKISPENRTVLELIISESVNSSEGLKNSAAAELAALREVVEAAKKQLKQVANLYHETAKLYTDIHGGKLESCQVSVCKESAEVIAKLDGIK